ncbi:MAG: endolytic transglycosylase MltG [Acidimicrobiia bacterium]
MTVLDEPDYDRRRSDWEVDEWDEVGEVPAVEPVRQQTRIVKWVVWAALVLTVVLVLVAGYVGWWYLERVQPEGEAGPPRAFTVTTTDTMLSVSERLQVEGFVVDAEVFRWYVDQQGGVDLTPGFYQIPVNDHMGNVLSRLRTPPDQTYESVTFPEGFTIAQMGERLADVSPRLEADAFTAAANSPEIPSLLRPPGVTSMEGLLFPDTYRVSNADNEAQVVLNMAGLMERVAEQEDLIAGAAEVGLTPYEVLIVASMIEKEAKLDVDRPKIARVIYNRLFLGMNLQIDATLYYQGDRDTPFPVLRQTPGPYNTYLNAGLPPTPIANPGRASIRAALNPAPNPPPGDPICRDLDDPTQLCWYLYYVLADEDGGHAFATTLEQHEANIEAARAAGIL